MQNQSLGMTFEKARQTRCHIYSIPCGIVIDEKQGKRAHLPQGGGILEVPMKLPHTTYLIPVTGCTFQQYYAL